MTDADVDGAHIRTLLLTLFYRYLPQIIHQGHLYIAQPPLYRVQVGKEARYVYSDNELEKNKQELITIVKDKKLANKDKKAAKEEKEEAEESVEESGVEAGSEGERGIGEITEVGGIKFNIQRYKGLGEMNPSQLWETTMSPETRLMKQVTVEDAAKMDEVFDILMGSEVGPRKHFIQSNAKNVKNLDI
jgi:DNA gyrase subunit B